MSGQCGMVRWDGAGVESSWISAMVEAARWRGVDGVRQEVRGEVGFGYLSHEVTPESVGEQQPLVHGETGIMVSADVRLDNREELPAQGGASDSDAQLLLASYLRWGSECALRLLGDFAWVVWDPREQRVYLCRDAMGMRPLYYRVEPNRVIWASEVKQILAAPGVERRLNEMAIATHLSGSYLPLGMSFYEGIAQVTPGEIVAVDAKRVSSRRYWQVDPNRRIRYRREQEYALHFRELFQRAVESRLRSVKPVGISLSGGMDSGSVASMVGWMYEQGVSRYTPEFRSYSWAFDELVQCDERAVSRLITDRYGIPAVDIPADDAWPLRDYPLHGPDVDEPNFGIFQVLLDAGIGAAAADGAGVVISGDRGDLINGDVVLDLPGILLAGQLRAFLSEARVVKAYYRSSWAKTGWRHVVRPLLGRAANRLGRRPRVPSGLSAAKPPSHIRADFLSRSFPPGYVPPSAACRSLDPAVRKRYSLIFTELHMQGMIWSERTNARLGVDFADVWSDRRIAEFILSIPQHVVHRATEHKRIVKRALDGIMPAPALAAVRKVSPQPLYLIALRERARDTVRSLCTGMKSAELGYVSELDFRRRIEELQSGKTGVFELWNTLTLEAWLRRYW